MLRSLFNDLFGVGRLPPEVMAELQTEGLQYLEEDVRGSADFNNFKRPGRTSAWRRNNITVAIALTRKRLYAARGSRPIINMPLTDPRLHSMRFTLEPENILCISFEAGLFHKDWSGNIRYHLHMTDPQKIISLLNNE